MLGSLGSAKQKKATAKQARQDILKHFSEVTLAHIKVYAVDKEAAQSLALRELKLTLDVLNFYTIYAHPPGMRVRVYLPGQALFHAFALTLSFKSNTGVSIINGIHGPLDLFVISKLNGDKGREVGLAQISRILAKEKRTTLEERIVAAMRFAGRATVDDAREEAFLKYAIALESLLGDADNKGEITFKLAVRCAHLIGQNQETRKSIRRQVSDLYGVRSKIVHRGNVELTDSQLGQISTYARYALVTVLTQEDFSQMSGEEKLLEWLDEKMLA